MDNGHADRKKGRSFTRMTTTRMVLGTGRSGQVTQQALQAVLASRSTRVSEEGARVRGQSRATGVSEEGARVQGMGPAGRSPEWQVCLFPWGSEPRPP